MPAVVRSEFNTTDADEAREVLGAAYATTRMRRSGRQRAVRLEYVRHDLGSVRLDDVHHALTTDYGADPFGCLQIVRVLSGTVTYDTDGREQQFGPGDVVLPAQPDKPFTACIDQARLQVSGLDLALLAEVTGEPPLDTAPCFASGALSAAQVAVWQRAASYAKDTVSRPEAQAPLVLDAVRRLLASAALAVFDPDVAVDASRDRADATPAAVRRAVSFFETNPDLEIGVADAARAGFVSVRALQVAFRRHLDTTPMAYLRRVRMDRVHADLVAADPAATTVTAVTAQWGFHSVGRFSADYRNTFGEHPRDTLRRR